MEQKQLIKNVLNFNKYTFNHTYNTMEMLFSQTEKIADTLCRNPGFNIPSEGQDAVNMWISTLKKGRNDIKKIWDDNFKQIEDYVNSNI